MVCPFPVFWYQDILANYDWNFFTKDCTYFTYLVRICCSDYDTIGIPWLLITDRSEGWTLGDPEIYAMYGFSIVDPK